MPKERKIFEFEENGKKFSIHAGGILLYRINEINNEPELLLIYGRGKYEEFGGIADKSDKNINEMVAREAMEESNGLLIFEATLKKLLDPKTKYFYSERSKYMLFIAKASDSEAKLKSENFGLEESLMVVEFMSPKNSTFVLSSWTMWTAEFWGETFNFVKTNLGIMFEEALESIKKLRNFY